MNLNYLKDRKILILGFAREGIDTLRFLRKLFPAKILAVADQTDTRRLTPDAEKLLQKDKNTETYFGPDYLGKIGDYDVVIKSPGIPPKIIKPYLKRNQIVTSQTQIFFENCPGQIIGITGTKGKSTTASLIYAVLEEGGLKAHLVGNIGKPVLSALFKAEPKDIYVYELSSHQLMGLKISPPIAVFLNIYSEHRDYYRNFAEYLKAKQNICRYQKKDNIFLFNPQDKNVFETSKITRAKRVILNPKSAEEFSKKWGRAKLVGKFNFLNISAAIEVGRIFKIPENKIAQAIKTFKPLPHRLELVGEYRGIKFYNDSLATLPEATIAALDALGKDVETIFLGGFDRGLDFAEFGKRIVKSKIKNLILFPASGQRIWRAIRRENLKRNQPKRFFNHFFVVPERNGGNKMLNLSYDAKNRRERLFRLKRVSDGASIMKEAVKLAFRQTAKGKICLLSCASPSFGLFRDYQERGDLFRKYVCQLRKMNENP